MFGITLSDLVYRRRQFVIATVGAGLVFAMTVLLAGLANGFLVEIDQTVSAFHADAWVIKAGSSGRVGSLAPFSQSDTARVAAAPGVTSATPVVVVPQTADVSGRLAQVNLIGSPVGSAPGRQPLTDGTRVAGPGQAVVDQRLHAPVGSRVTIGGRGFRVVGVTVDRTLLGGSPDMYVTLADAQAAAFQGAPIVERGHRHREAVRGARRSGRAHRRSDRSGQSAADGHGDLLDQQLEAVHVGHRGRDRGVAGLCDRTRAHPRLRRAEGARRLVGEALRGTGVPGGARRPDRRGDRRGAGPVHGRGVLATGRRPRTARTSCCRCRRSW